MGLFASSAKSRARRASLLAWNSIQTLLREERTTVMLTGTAITRIRSRARQADWSYSISYFTTSVPGAGIFLPVSKAIPRNETPSSANGSSFPHTPSASTYGSLRVNKNGNTSFTSPSPALPKFSASVGPGARAPSPQGRRGPSLSLRPESPVRRLQMTPGPRPSLATPGNRTPSVRHGSPTNRFASSVRGTAGDPNKKAPRLDHKPSMGPRSISAMGSVSGFEEEDTTPVGIHRTQTNGSMGSVSSLNLRMRSPSRAPSRAASRANGSRDEELERLRVQLEDRERQLKDQSTTLAEMESSLVELQGLMEHANAPQPRRDSIDDKDSSQLRRLLREKNEKIAMLTAEFDSHRADFRSTIDTLELASNETERVYEKRMDELMADIRELESRNLDVDSVATQLKQLEELVQELEEGLEDARRGEAEARGEVEFLRGEVERTRTELQREREKAAASSSPQVNGDPAALSKELEQKEDEIRGLKAIIHSLSRDSIPGEDRPLQRPGSFGQRPGSFSKRPGSFGQRPSSISADDAIANKIARDNLERQVAELQSILESKNSRENELEQELEGFRQTPTQAPAQPLAEPSPVLARAQRSSLRDSRDTVVLPRANEPRSPEAPHPHQSHKRGNTLDTMPESDAYSTATETSTLWCEICETNGHDILTCTNMFGPDGAKPNGNGEVAKPANNTELKPRTPTGDDAPAPLTPFKARNAAATTPVRVVPNPLESGPVAGKESGIMDPEKWCAVCERDGHDSVDCPFEDNF